MANPLLEMREYGQSAWYDYIRRGLIESGELRDLIERDGLAGITSNPAIFEKAIGGSPDYDAALRELERQRDMDVKDLYESLAIRDIRDAADALARVYARTRKRDGYVSLEVSPYLARDTAGTLDEARRLWRTVARPNLMIKVPATRAGFPAIRQLISEGINVNVTLLFGLAAYEEAAEAYLSGLEALVAAGGDPAAIASVASFFVSRIDSAIDALVTARLKTAAGAGEREQLRRVLGKVAIANARLAYERYKEIVRTPRWRALAEKGARPQRLLWASTGTKNPSYRDVLYVEELIGSDTVNTLPAATFDAFREHGRARASLEENPGEARATLELAERLGISLKEVTERLLEEGVKSFADSFDKLLGAVEKKRKAVLGPVLNRQSYVLPGPLAAAVRDSLEEWRASGKVRRLWARDSSLWTRADEARWLGWLGLADEPLADTERLRALAAEAKEAGFTHALVLGMGGSSLCPEVLAATLGNAKGFPELHVLDSTDPAQILSVERGVDLARTLFIVSSKSGTTLEPNILKQYFYERVKRLVGAGEVGNRFIAITDPGSSFQQVAEREGFRHVYFGVPSIGGRYSALSDFGMVPAAILGVDVGHFLERAGQMVHSCHSCVPPEENPGVALGTILGVLARHGRDKVTLVASPGIQSLGAWLEQLLAESTGKSGRGLIPVDLEKLGAPEVYGDDRLFVYARLESAPDAAQDAAIDALQKAGQPVVRILVADPCDLGQEFFRWEIATAVAGSILGVNPFDQPDVEASKVATRQLTSEYESKGSLPEEEPILVDRGIRLFADPRNAAELEQRAGGKRTFEAYLRAHLGRLLAGDYFCLLAYMEMKEAHRSPLQAMRLVVRDAKKVATCLGFGPRYLHSTGQAYKGGPDSGVFLQITCDDATDLPVPGRKYAFGVVKAAQARGDFDVLVERGRRALRVHLGGEVAPGLAALRRAVDQALA